MLTNESIQGKSLDASIKATIGGLIAPGKGILAADESFPTIEKRFKAFNIPGTEENRRAYREMLFTTEGLGAFIGGGILFDETLRQRTNKGIPFAVAMTSQGIIPGIKVDEGTIPFVNFPGEKLTQGLDGLRERLAGYRELGARFTKWRAVIKIGAQLPTRACIAANARALAQFAALSQETGLAPIVEPEVLFDGDHSIERCEEVTTETLREVFAALIEQRVALEQMLLKTGMVLSGSECPEQAGDKEVAERTLRCFRRSVPAAVPGIVFLSGGQEAEEATRRMNAICKPAGSPWTLSYSFGRALQAPALEAWKGLPGNLALAQKALHLRAENNSAAIQGKYSTAMETVSPPSR